MTGSAPLIGRDEEVRVLRRAAQAVRESGAARIVTVVGSSGAGKSSVIDAALEQVGADPGRRFRVYRGSARDSSEAYGALASLLRHRFGIVDGAAIDDTHAQIRGQVSKVLDDRKVGDVCFFIGQILDVPFPDSPLTRAVRDDVGQARFLRRAIIKNFFESDAARGPVCLVFDDLDASGENFSGIISHLIEHATGPILIVCSMRPEVLNGLSGWLSRASDRHTRLDLGPLTPDVSAEVMRALLSPCEGGAPEPLVSAGVRLAGGNAGLMQAMVRLFHDSGVLEEAHALAREPVWQVRLEKLAAAKLPVTVDDAVSLRVAALSPSEEQLLAHAALVGNSFWVGALVCLSRVGRKVPGFWALEPESEVESIETALELLEQRDYVVKMPNSSLPGETQYAFKHNLERQKLAAALGDEQRRSYHQTIADWLEQRRLDHPTREHLALSAAHLDASGASMRAGLAHLAAADAARANYAARSAEEHYARGLALLGDSDAERRIDALHNHGDVLATLGKIDDALGRFREMLSIAYRLDLRAKGGAAHNRIGRLYRAMGSLAEARHHIETALALFASVGDDRGVAACHDDVGMLLWTKGEYEPALERMRTALDMRKVIGERRSIALSLHNIGVVFRDHGNPTRAQEALEASLQIRTELGDRIGVAQTLDSLGRLAQEQRELERARDLFKQAYDVAREVGERNFIAVVLTNLGEVHFRLGNTSQAIILLTEAEELCDELGDRLHLAEAKRGLATAYLKQGDLKKARSNIKHAVDLLGQIRSKSLLAIALRTLGEITAAGAWGAAHEGKSIDYFMRAIVLSKEIGNETEIAKSYLSFSDYVARSNHYKDNERIQHEAKKLRAMADEIFARQRISAESVGA
jgi:tetratricopeptide (TPR) repeat protein